MIVELKPVPEDTDVPDGLLGIRPPPSFAFADRRCNTRYATNDPAKIKLLGAGGGPSVDGTVLDVSRGGLRIESPARFDTGLRLQIVLPDRTVIFGESRYCRQVSRHYQVGVAIEIVYYAQPLAGNHIENDQLKLYAAGGGLTSRQALYVKNHLFTCGTCAAHFTGAGQAENAQPSKDWE